MMAEKLSPMFDAPIAGQSMTAELGSRPWQSEPKYKTPKEAVGILVIPALIETLIFIAEENKVKYVIGTEKFDDSDLVDPSSLTLAIKKYKNKTNVVEDNPAVENLLEQDKEVMSEAPVGGLMSRRA